MEPASDLQPELVSHEPVPDGRADRRLRAWSFLALLILVPFPSIAIADGIHFDWNGVTTVFFGFAKFWILIVPLAWTFLVDKAPLSWSPPKRGGFVPAIAIGIATAMAIFLGFTLIRSRLNLPGVRDMASRAHITGPISFVIAATYWSVINSLLEEYVWRWFVFVKLEHLLSPVADGPLSVVAANAARQRAQFMACLLATLFFTAHHAIALGAYIVWPLALLGTVGVFVGGLTWSWLYCRYRSIWPGFIAHVLADAAIFAAAWPLVLSKGA